MPFRFLLSFCFVAITTKQNETKRNKTKQNETKRNKTKQNETKPMFGNQAHQFMAATENRDAILAVMEELWLSDQEKAHMADSLVEYMYVENVQDLKCGGTVRWIDISSLAASEQGLHSASKISTISFTDETFVVKNFLHRTYRLDFNQNLVFQKVSAQELSRQRVADHFTDDGDEGEGGLEYEDEDDV